MNNKLRRTIIAASLIIIGVTARLVFHEFPIAPNVEIVTAFSLLAGFYLGGWFVLLVPLGIMAGSDFFLGNSPIYLFTWSAYLIAGLFGYLLRSGGKKRLVLKALGAGIGFSVFFYLYSNFGVWLITPWYERSVNGLLYCYYMGLPFLKYNLVGNLLFVPAGFTAYELILRRRSLRTKIPAVSVIPIKK